MKNKILEEAIKWYENQEEKPEVFIEDFVELVINKTADNIFEKVRDELNNEFKSGNLKHPFIISSDYYLDLKLKEIKQKCIKSEDSETSSEE
ncbi:MAG: hypothetical protein JSW62_05445 [Thermoplasmatales archaeon]|nr:MAG: hypothetical protein JSW62_05445 [Thermoplasmatales archaeon]